MAAGELGPGALHVAATLVLNFRAGSVLLGMHIRVGLL